MQLERILGSHYEPEEPTYRVRHLAGDVANGEPCWGCGAQVFGPRHIAHDDGREEHYFCFNWRRLRKITGPFRRYGPPKEDPIAG